MHFQLTVLSNSHRLSGRNPTVSQGSLAYLFGLLYITANITALAPKPKDMLNRRLVFWSSQLKNSQLGTDPGEIRAFIQSFINIDSGPGSVLDLGGRIEQDC